MTTRRGDDGLPPSLNSPTWRQVYRFMTGPLELLDECRGTLGDIFTLNLGGLGRWVLLSSPADLKTLFTGSAEQLHAGEANEKVFGAVIGPATVVTLDEERHLRRRRLLTPPFQGDAVKQHAKDMAAIAETAVRAWPVGRPFSLREAVQRISLDVILRVIFGVEPTPEHRRLGRLIVELANAAASPLLFMPALQWDLSRFSPWGRVVHAIRRADAAIYREIASRRAASGAEGRTDLLSLLLQVRYDDGTPLSDRELRDELTTMLLAGHETTATAMAWTFERILSHPDVEENVLAELALSLDGRTVTAEGISKLDYLDAVIKETHRLRPVMPIGGSRKVMAPFEVGGYRLVPGTVVTNCMYLLHRRADLYPDPERFLPQRFLGIKPDPYRWTPFGGGVRRCLGMALATLEMKVVLATVLGQVRLRLETPDVAIRRRGFFLAPEGGPKVTVTGVR